MMCTAELLKKFHLLQTERVETYKLFDEGHGAYLKGTPNYNFSMYRQLVHEITQTFHKISADIMNIIKVLKEENKANTVVHCMEKVQLEEKKKLELTVKLQISKQNVIDHPDEDQYKGEVAEYKESLAQIRETINESLEELKYESEDLLQDSS